MEDPRRGLYFVDHGPKHVWTQCQDSDAKFWFPCFDHPAEKQTTSASITVPKGQFALSNGALAERVESADETTFRYEQAIPHSVVSRDDGRRTVQRDRAAPRPPAGRILHAPGA